jgi:tRNA-2-methylthio-N6-dimethylallyladenosine synthase
MKRFFLESYGCQMNDYDTEGMERLLVEHGYTRVGAPEQADVLLVNTCSVREHAEERALNRLAEFTRLKTARPGLVVAATGCMAQRLGDGLRRKIPRLDVIVGSQALPAVLDGVEQAARRHAEGRRGRPFVAAGPLDHYLPPPAPRPGENRLRAFVAIIRGCDKRCAFCVVPYTRGPEVSRPSDVILCEAADHVAAGAVELTLIGQNVNAYTSGGVDFPELLHRVGSVPGLRRLRFTTSHPRDMSRAAVARIAAAPRLAPWLHLPVQTGSPRLLAEMAREHSLEHYLEVVAAAREAIPDLALTTDIIVGFPGETGADFALTLQLLERVRYDTLYAFRYSPRSGTPAALRADDVPAPEKHRRIAAVIDRQRRISHAVNQRFVGRELEVLVESRDRRRGQWLTRTGHNKILVLSECRVDIGGFARARVERATGQTLYGTFLGDGGEA